MRLFFYGTLMEAGGNRVAAAAHTRLGRIGAATARGRLYAIADRRGWYPALMPGSDEVFGVVYEALPSFGDSDLARIDAYEGYDPQQLAASLYRRAAINLDMIGIDAARREQAPSAAMAYLYNRTLPADAPVIPGGNFEQWLRQTGNPGFCP